MSKVVILLDMDDVLNYSVEKVLELYNKEYHKDIVIEQITEWDLAKCVGDSTIYKYYGDQSIHFFRNIRPQVGAVEGVQKMIDLGFQVKVVTSVGKDNIAGIQDKKEDIKEYFPMIEEVIIAQDKSGIEGDIMIDDGIKNISKTKAKYKLLYDRPYNQGYTGEHIRVHNFEEILKILEQIKECII